MMDRVWSATELELLQRLVSFFAETPDRQMELVSDFDTDQYFETFEGHVETRFPLLVLTMELANWAYRYEQNSRHPNRDIFSEISSLTYLVKDAATLPPDFWSVSSLTEPGVWSILRRLCGTALDAFPACRRMTKQDAHDLLAELY